MKDRADVRERALALFAGRARRALGIQKDVVVLITDNDEVREMNRRYRKKNEPTDVLSFPSALPQMGGDIAISVEIAQANSKVLGHSLETELKILILHGLLHIAGYDHETDNGEMRAKETILRQELKLPTGLIERAHGSVDQRDGQAGLVARKERRR
jgi:probable rRNA maturation factor